MSHHLDHSAARPGRGRLIDPSTLRTTASMTLGVAAISAVLAGAGLAMTGGGEVGGQDTSPAPSVLPDPSATPVPNPPFPDGLTATERQHLLTFDELDFVVFSQADWGRLGESHARNIRVHFPDGHYRDGIDNHAADMQAIFDFAPDTHIHSHPIRIAKDSLTCVIGVMAGTFTRPMADGNGGTVAPTGRPYSITMATVGVWNTGGTMDEEWLFWDNKAFDSQLGL